MGAFRWNVEDEVGSSYPESKSDVVPALRSHDLPRLWDDEGEDHEDTGLTGLMPPSVRSRGNPHLTIMTGLGAQLVIGRSRS